MRLLVAPHQHAATRRIGHDFHSGRRAEEPGQLLPCTLGVDLPQRIRAKRCRFASARLVRRDRCRLRREPALRLPPGRTIGKTARRHQRGRERPPDHSAAQWTHPWSHKRLVGGCDGLPPSARYVRGKPVLIRTPDIIGKVCHADQAFRRTMGENLESATKPVADADDSLLARAILHTAGWRGFSPRGQVVSGFGVQALTTND